MKKVFLGLMAVLVSMTLFAERVSVEDAALVANNFMNVASANSNVKKAIPAKRMVRKVMSEENLYYLYENADGEGWVIIAADDAVTPVLAYSNTGHFRTDNMPSNIRKWVGKYNNFIKKIEDDGVVASEETSAQWKKLRKGLPDDPAGTIVVGPLVQTQWDQDDPYYNLCPGSGSSKAYTGCVATAMAQVMKYWEWPKRGKGSHTYQPLDPNSNTGAKSKRYGQQSANFGATTYDWDNMCNSYSGSETSAQKTAVATLMYHCGVATEMMYGNDADGGSGTYTVNYGDWDDYSCAQSSLAEFFRYDKSKLTGYMRDGYTYNGTKYYDSWTDAAWTAMVKAELDLQHPIMYGGAGNGSGHSFICDGYDSQDYFHFNWGWSGSNDGWYKLSNLVPGSGGAGGGSYSFSEEQDVIIGIVPDETVQPTVVITWSVNGGTTTSEFEEGEALILPTAPSACTDGRVFVGWTAQSSVSGTKPSDLITESGEVTVTEPTTYYAVFATAQTEGGTEQTSTYTFTSKAWADATKSWTSNQDGSQYNNDNKGVQVTTNSTGAGATSKNSFSDVSKVVVKYCTNASKGAGNIEFSIGSTSVVQNVTKTGGTTLRDLQFDFNNVSGNATIEVNCTTNSIYVNSVAITYGGTHTTYSNYSLSCEGAQGIENTKVEAPAAYKTLIDGRIVIVRGDAVYTLTGARVR